MPAGRPASSKPNSRAMFGTRRRKIRNTCSMTTVTRCGSTPRPAALRTFNGPPVRDTAVGAVTRPGRLHEWAATSTALGVKDLVEQLKTRNPTEALEHQGQARRDR